METFNSCEYGRLKFDEACVQLNNPANIPHLWLYTLSSDCISCPYSRRIELKESNNLTVNTARSQFWKVIETDGKSEFISASDDGGLYWKTEPNIGQYGIYEYLINSNKTCTLKVDKEPTNPHIPLAIAFGTLALLLLCLSLLKWTRRWMQSRQKSAEEEPPPKKSRIRSLDTVRGMSILLMILVNFGAGGYWYLDHATWDGLCLGDLVFPCFMWIMGVCIPLSVSAQLSRGSSRLSVCRAIVKRSLYLFFVGLCMNTLGGRIQLEEIRLFGVLQRFSISYLVVGLIYTLAHRKSEGSGWARDVLILLPQWTAAFCILAAHCAIMFAMPVPGCPKGYLGPGGRHADAEYENCTGGVTGYLDKLILGVKHIYQIPTTDTVYGSGPFDPEGILGCLTSIFQVFLGVQAGQTLREFASWQSRLLRWLSWALALGLVGLALHFTHIIPVNKNLWSISFVLVTSCLNLGLLSVCYILIDVLGVWEGGPFRIPGMNALVMFVGHQAIETFPFRWRIGEMNTHAWLLAENLWGVALWVCIAYVLHRKRIYVTL